MELIDWLDEYSGPNYVWYAKRLAANDTKATGANQAGPHISKHFLFRIFPSINRTDVKNPDQLFTIYIDSHADRRDVRAIYYNNKYHENPTSGRDEARITRFGGAASALLDPESTGALTVFAFKLNEQGAAVDCHVWVSRHETEEDIVEDRIGPVDPGKAVIWPATQLQLFAPAQVSPVSCWLSASQIPPEWLVKFPTGMELVLKAIALRPDESLDPDQRLMRRRDCEYEIFRSVEEAVELPHLTSGFSKIDQFIERAQTILQRRKARAGRSLELHARQVFIEERLKEDEHFSYQPESEPNKSPDFLFPSEAAYKDSSFPTQRLRMLAVKTTCKDRWRQIVKEADRIPVKHLLTVQQGVSENQFREMTEAGVRLVVPKKVIESYPNEVRPHLQTLESFIGDIRLLLP